MVIENDYDVDHSFRKKGENERHKHPLLAYRRGGMSAQDKKQEVLPNQMKTMTGGNGDFPLAGRRLKLFQLLGALSENFPSVSVLQAIIVRGRVILCHPQFPAPTPSGRRGAPLLRSVAISRAVLRASRISLN